MFTFKDLFKQVVETVEKYATYPHTDSWDNQLEKTNVNSQVLINTSTVATDTGELANVLSDLFEQLAPQRIKSGLTVEATVPTSNQVIVKAGEGSVGSKIYNLTKEQYVTIPFDGNTAVFYINLFVNGIQVEKTTGPDRICVAKIIVPTPSFTNLVVKDNEADDFPYDAYIINLKEYILHGDDYGNLEEDSLEFLRNNIGDILADNLIGNIRLSEDLKIINTTGSVQLDSTSLKILNDNEDVLAKFNKNGVFLYNGSGIEVAKFTGDEARIGNIKVLKNALQSGNYSAGSTGFIIRDNGDVEFNNMEIRGTIYATAGEIGGWTIASNMLYGTTTGTIKTSSTAGAGSNGVVLDIDGLRVYDDVLGLVVNLPSNGSAPSFSSGTITSVTFEINTNSILRTSATVGDGSANSYGILINNTGLYGCGANQNFTDANLKVLANGDVSLSGEIVASQGQIGTVTITTEKLSGGIIEGALIRGGIFETSETLPKLRIDATGMYYQVTSSVGKYGASGSGLDGFMYGDGTLYGTGVRAFFANVNFPPVAILAEDHLADIRLYNRLNNPIETGPHALGDLICVEGIIKYCVSAGSVGTFVPVGGIIENRTNDTGCTQEGRIWLRTDV